jgi:hypothetical protein
LPEKTDFYISFTTFYGFLTADFGGPSTFASSQTNWTKAMKKIAFLFLILVGSLSGSTLAQENHTECVAAFVGSKMVVDEYTTTGKCRLPITATGELAIFTVDLGPTENKALDKIDFRVAIRDKATGTLTMFSGKRYRQVPVQDILARCQKGDHIVLLTEDDRYALPHNEILIQ